VIRFTSSLLALAGALFYAGAAYAQTAEADAGRQRDRRELDDRRHCQATRSATAIPQARFRRSCPASRR
jgi:hypothetical protein